MVLDDLRKVGGLRLDAGHVPVVPHTELPQAQAADEGFGPADLFEGFDRDRVAVGKAGRQAGQGRLVRRGQAKALRQRADVGLGEPGVLQRTAHAVFPNRQHAGTEVADVVQDAAFADEGGAFLPGDLLEARIQFIPAEIAPSRVVLHVLRVVDFLRVHVAVPGAHPFSQFGGLVLLFFRQ